MEILTPTPQLTIVSGPMGGGKSGANLAAIEGMQGADMATWGMERVMSISKTSRSRRKELDPPESEDAYDFDQPVDLFTTAGYTGAIMEKTEHSGTHYGSPTPPSGQPTHFEIEVSGLRQILESTHPEVMSAREGLRAIYLLQDSMGALATQITGRNDGMSLEKKMQRIARYPSEIMYILERELPYGFILNANGRPQFMEAQVLRYMLRDPEAITQSKRLAEQKAKESFRWLARMGLKPEQVIDPVW